jgi:predicted AAA+ superfamily ATPase
MFRLFAEADLIDDGKLIAVTNPEFEELCQKKNWVYLERKGARVGSDNADRIEEIVRELCKQ